MKYVFIFLFFLAFICGLFIPIRVSAQVRSPRYDIVETGHIYADRPDVQVGDTVNFTATIENVSSQRKHLTQLGFESSFANIGFLDDIYLDPGQSFSFNGSGVWHEGGVENVWVSWSQDNINFYRPLNGKTVQVNVVD